MGDGPSQSSQSSQTMAQSGTSQRNPWVLGGQQVANLISTAAGQPASISGAETGALDQLVQQGQRGNPFAGQIGGVANTLLSGGGPDRSSYATDAYSGLLSNIGGTARGDYTDPTKNPFFQATTDAIGNDVMRRINNEYIGAGRDPSGAGNLGYTVGKGIGEATAPIFANTYAGERANQLTAANSLFNAGGSTAGLLSDLDQTRLGNMTAGIGAADAANQASMFGPQSVLAAEAYRRGVPLETLARQMGIILPATAAFGSTATNSTAQGTGTQDTQQEYGALDYSNAASKWFQPMKIM